MRYRFLLVFTLFLIVPFTGLAEMVKGTVVDGENRKPLSGSHIQVQGTHIITTTDSDGFFSINIPENPKYILQVSHVGYAHAYFNLTNIRQNHFQLEIELKPGSVELDEVVFTATRSIQLLKDVPVSTELVSGKEIEQSASFTASEALESQIGIDIRNDFSGNGISLQGVDPERVLILVDGSRVIGRINGSIDLDQLSTQGIKQIEIVKGAVSTLYGSEAIGGVVNIITDDPIDELKISSQITSGGFFPGNTIPEKLEASTFSPSLDFSLKKEKTSFRSGFKYSSKELIDLDPSTNHTDGTEGSDRFNGEFRLKRELTAKSNLIASGHAIYEEKYWVEDAGLQSVQVSYDDEETNISNDQGLEYQYVPQWGEQYSVRLFHSNYDHEWSKYTRNPRSRKDFSTSIEDYTELSLQFTRNLGSQHRLTTGADYYWWNINSESVLGSFKSTFDSKLTAWDIYLQDEYLYSKKLSVVPGIRYEKHKIYGDHISPKISTRFELMEDLNIRLSVGKGYRAPSSKELYYVFNHVSAGYIVLGNSNLNPETSTSYSISLEHIYEDRSTSRINFFYNDLNNLIDFDSLGVSEEYYVGIYQYGNIVDAFTRGIELERSMRFGKYISTDIAYRFLDTQNRETERELLRRPKHTIRSSFTISDKKSTFRMWVNYTGQMLFQDIYTTDDQVSEEKTNPYTTVNFVLSRTFLQSKIFAKVENLFDTTDARYGPYRGRMITLGLRYDFIKN